MSPLPPGARWNSLPHEPLEGALERRLCQAPRCEDLMLGPHPAHWLEMIWMPKAPIADCRVYSAWFTCHECHAGMMASMEGAGDG